MDRYIVSARKYRPETFISVIGQPSITTTLKNAIRNGQLAHAYLFCGPRGVGKTTCARILAKTINCFNITENTEACNECESCKSFITSRSYNIHELDAASNNSVDDIRNLIEQVRIPPQLGKYSIYIIDEVHMLSAQAFNAFLKTLEEPPPHAIFILATTEKHKIMPTILSRCQIFDFNRIKIDDIVRHLESIAKTEKIDAEVEGLNIIAQKADGALRDALSIFDQLVSFSEGKITYQKVIDNLNVLDYDYYFKITDTFLSGNIPGSLMIFNKVLEKGFDGHNFINGLSRHFRDLLVCRDEVTLQLLEVGAGAREKYRSQSKACSLPFLISALSVTNQCDLSFRSSRNQRLHVELSLVQLCDLVNSEKKKPEPSENRLKEEKPAGTAGESPKSGKKDDTSETGVKQAAGTESPKTAHQMTEAQIRGYFKPKKGHSATREPKPEKSAPTSGQAAGSGRQQEVKSPEQTAATTPKEPVQTTLIPGPDTPEEPRQETLISGPSRAEKPESGALRQPLPGKEKDEPAPASYPGDQKQALSDRNAGDRKTELTESNAGNRKKELPETNPGTLSIKDALKGTLPQKGIDDDIAGTDDQEDLLVIQESDDDFTEKELIEQWKKFANQIRNKHPRLYNTLMANKPTINSRTGIEFEISNPLQMEALDKIKPELLGHLRRELNKNIEMVVTINETLKESRLYLPEDKYEHMVRKNPDLSLFRQKFNLDFE